MITVKQSEGILKKFSNLKILVVGDLMLDRYVTGTVSRISPEAPVPVVCVTDETCRPGGAANVALNIQKLGAKALVVGLVGNDENAITLTGILKGDGISIGNIVVSEVCRTTVKTRVVAERQQVVRVDYEDTRDLVEQSAEDMCASIREAVEDVDGIIIADYNKGVVSQAVVDAVLASASKRNLPVGLDPKDDREWKISGIKLATPNYKEACAASGLPARPLKDGDLEKDPVLREAGIKLMKKWGPELLIITLGAHGMYLLNKDDKPAVISTKAREVFDVSGAGDTVIAAAFLALVAGADHNEAVSLANYAAGVVVGKLGTATCSPAELLASMAQV